MYLEEVEKYRVFPSEPSEQRLYYELTASTRDPVWNRDGIVLSKLS